MPIAVMSRAAAASLAAAGRHVLAAPLEKAAAADPTGGQDSSFEASLSNLAHTHLKDKAPGLLPYEVGFQLLDRNEDNTRAVAIAGFKVGSQWLYAPVFFLNGELKGTDLLYLKDSDQFVPLKENWLNWILNRKPNVLGKPVDRNSTRLGMTFPDLQAFSRPPSMYSKTGAAAGWFRPGAAAFRAAAATNPLTAPKYAAGMPDLPAFLRKEGAAAVDRLVRTLAADADLAAAFDRVHGVDTLRAVVEEVKAAAAGCGVMGPAQPPAGRGRKKKPGVFAPEPEPEKAAALVSVVVGTAYSAAPVRTGAGPDLTAAEREKLLADGYVVRDGRADRDVTKAYAVSGRQALTVPTATGLYDVLVKPGGWEKCFVALWPYGRAGRADFATVVRLDGGRREYVNAHPTRVFVSQAGPEAAAGQVGSGFDGYDRWLDDLPAAAELPEDDGVYMVVGPRGQASLPFRVRAELAGDGDQRVYDVGFRDWPDYDRRDGQPRAAVGAPGGYGARGDGPHFERVRLTGKAGRTLTVLDGELLVPAGFKLLTVREPADPEAGVLSCMCGGGPERSPLLLGTDRDVTAALWEKTAGLRVSRVGDETVIEGRGGVVKAASTPQAVACLVVGHGLREAAAVAVLEKAAARRAVDLRVKYAAGYGPPTDGYSPLDSAPTAPGFPDPPYGIEPTYAGGVFSQYPQEALLAVHMNRQHPYPYDNSPPDPQTIQSAVQAAQTGQKEVFDTTMIGSLLTAGRSDSMVDRNLGPLMKGMDRLGRILFSFYWHNDEFADRYGKADMPDIEESLRNSFQDLGDVVLKLKLKSVEPFPDEMAAADVSDAARM